MNHKETKHVHVCDIYKEWDGGQEFRGEAEIARHNLLGHENKDNTLTDAEFDNLFREDHKEIENGPETPRKLDLAKRNQEQKKKKEEEQKNKREEDRKKREEERKKKMEEGKKN